MALQRLQTAAVALVLLWFVVIAPGHQRGVLTLPGPTASRAIACCPLSAAAPASQDAQDAEDTKDPQPTRPCHDPAQSCAICQLVTTLATPAHVDLTPPPLGVLPWHPCTAVRSQSYKARIRTFEARPPPSRAVA